MTAWSRWLLVGLMVLAGAVGMAGRGGHGETAAASGISQGEVELEGAQAEELAARVAAGVPLPAGGNFNGIRWAELDGTITAAQVQEVVEYNAACQWYRALRDGRQAADARRIIAEVPGWEGVRGRATGELAAGVAADVAAGGGATLTGVLRQCDDSHRRQVAYAEAHGKVGER